MFFYFPEFLILTQVAHRAIGMQFYKSAYFSELPRKVHMFPFYFLVCSKLFPSSSAPHHEAACHHVAGPHASLI